jgi:queuine tRNA-ribosyltransferase
MVPGFSFRVTHRAGRARRGVLTTPHGPVETPVFMPVGTRGAVKALTARDLEDLGATMILGNTYHLFLRPGDGLIARRGGLHRFIGWDRPMLTDSGGYQVFSLNELRRITEEGAHFRSHLDGAAHLLSPEASIDIQANLGADIAMAFDECAPYPATEAVARVAMERSLRWAARSRRRLEALRAGEATPNGGPLSPVNPGQAQFGIVQGGVHPVLREASVAGTTALGFEGYAIGGLSVGEPVSLMYDIVEQTAPALPEEQPRYLMGTGTPDDLVAAVARGIDMFDCVLPTRNARNGQVLTRRGPMNLRNARYAEDDRPIDEACRCYTCRHFSRAYLRHLATVNEMTGATLNTIHNLYFYLDTMREIRHAIEFGSFETYSQAFLQTFSRRSVTQ